MPRCPDVWVLDGYLDEAGWDGQHQQLYFSTKRDAEAFGKVLAAECKDFNDGIGYDYEVYQVSGRPSTNAAFAPDLSALKQEAKELAEEWMER